MKKRKHSARGVKSTAPRRMPASPERFCSRSESRDGLITELGIGTDLAEQIAVANNNHARTGLKTWVWSLRTGKTLHRSRNRRAHASSR